MHFRHKLALRSTCVFSFAVLFLYMPKCHLQLDIHDFSALKHCCWGISGHGHPTSHVLAYTRSFAYVCNCSSLSLFFHSQSGCFHDDGSILSCIVLVFLFADNISVSLFKNVLSTQYFVNEEKRY